MVKHIYGGINLLEKTNRPHIFLKELQLYIDYLKKDSEQHLKILTDKKRKQLNNFKQQLLQGIKLLPQTCE